MQSKKKTLLRIALYIVLAYLPVYVLGFAFSDKEGGVTSALAGNSLMLFPAIAVIITRLITKEGFKDALLGTGRRKSGKYYAAAVIFPVLLPLVSGLILHLFIVKSGSIGDSAFCDNGMLTAALLLTAPATGLAMAAHGFGEELGWRGYLTPKLEELMPTPLAIVVTGIIWALWHGPLLAYGYDFGRDYDFFPYGGFIAMIVMCIALSAFLTWLTKRTDSVYPAALCHMVLDLTLTSEFSLFAARADGTPFEYRVSEFWVLILSAFPVMIVCGMVCMVLLRKKRISD
ncbi:CPBP family intramembrane glutamic endopeptidase [Ruminococcus flavefaciens]|uniref:Membrane protease YdiL (CAAX protease family) n=1 Tax=Ruminococcus flavefaciens TaxID=1265 RepID=A0A315XUR1_RUMFL|nr:type II CAAX endopeptidase family protein [Ruminococcus flavefaciens]PWJ10136.1 membrane protease YdiL (CAAX protease family) [Ruminococcus flavefaciens]SSA52090.1 Membrane protease YdiL, CAAX protease family [Ruminococcus flavefaciens]